MRTTLAVLFLTSSALAAACGGGTPAEPPASSSTTAPAAEQTAPATTPPPAQAAPAEEKTASVEATQTRANPTDVAPPAGVPAPLREPKGPTAPASAPARPEFTRYDLKPGTGAEAVAGRSVTVHYTGWLYDPSARDQKGRQFDSSVGGAPFTFVLGAGQVIPGWDKGFDGMKVGARFKLLIPPDLGYGAAGAGGGIIPPNATLIFEIELMGVGGY